MFQKQKVPAQFKWNVLSTQKGTISPLLFYVRKTVGVQKRKREKKQKKMSHAT